MTFSSKWSKINVDASFSAPHIRAGIGVIIPDFQGAAMGGSYSIDAPPIFVKEAHVLVDKRNRKDKKKRVERK